MPSPTAALWCGPSAGQLKQVDCGGDEERKKNREIKMGSGIGARKRERERSGAQKIKINAVASHVS
jgi:hypothetical protein